MITDDMRRVSSFVMPKFDWTFDVESGRLTVNINGKNAGEYEWRGDVDLDEFTEDIQQVYIMGMLDVHMQVNENILRMEAKA